MPKNGGSGRGFFTTNLGRFVVRKMITLVARGRSGQHQVLIRQKTLGHRSLRSFRFSTESFLEPCNAFSIVIAFVIFASRASRSRTYLPKPRISDVDPPKLLSLTLISEDMRSERNRERFMRSDFSLIGKSQQRMLSRVAQRKHRSTGSNIKLRFGNTYRIGPSTSFGTKLLKIKDKGHITVDSTRLKSPTGE